MKDNNLSKSDVWLLTLSTFFLTLFLISVWNEFGLWIMNVHWIWSLLIGVVLIAKPLVSMSKNN